jgi:hypothetical protein
MDHRRAASALRSDVNAFTDVAGDTGVTVRDLMVRVTGPMTLSAGLWLPGGERSLSDAGARRDVAQSLASGLREWVRSVRAATGAARLTVVVDEPQAAAVLSGALPTASGYRTVRSIPRSEVRQGWTLVAEAALDGGATDVAYAPGRHGAVEGWDWPELALLASEALPAVPPAKGPEQDDAPGGMAGVADERNDVGRGLVLPLAPLEGTGADPARWEIIAGWAEAGRTLTLQLPPPGNAQPGPVPGTPLADRPYRDTAVGIARTWERIGLDPQLLSRVVLGAPDLSSLTRHAANRTLAATVSAAEELEHIRQDGGF